MKAKVVEVRDSGTFIPMLAIQLGGSDITEQERWLLSSAGFGVSRSDQEKYVILVKINGGEPCAAHCDPFSWDSGSRTYQVAHQYLVDNFDDVHPGSVLDVQFVLGETPCPKTSDRYFVSR